MAPFNADALSKLNREGGELIPMDSAKLPREQRRKLRAAALKNSPAAKPLPASELKLTEWNDKILVGILQPGFVSLDYDEAQTLYDNLEVLLGKLAERQQE